MFLPDLIIDTKKQRFTGLEIKYIPAGVTQRDKDADRRNLLREHHKLPELQFFDEYIMPELGEHFTRLEPYEIGALTDAPILGYKVVRARDIIEEIEVQLHELNKAVSHIGGAMISYELRKDRDPFYSGTESLLETIVSAVQVFWYPNYAVTSPIEQLLKYNRVTFDAGGSIPEEEEPIDTSNTTL